MSVLTESLIWTCVLLAAMATGLPFTTIGLLVNDIVDHPARAVAVWLVEHTRWAWPMQPIAPPAPARTFTHALDVNFKFMYTELAVLLFVAPPTLLLLALTVAGFPSLQADRARVRAGLLVLLAVSLPTWYAWAMLASIAEVYWIWATGEVVATVPGPAAAYLGTIMHGTWWASPSWGALLGFVLSVCVVARVVATKVCARGASWSAPDWTRCTRCGYQAAPERPCPECGLDNPLALRRVYFGRWHARLMLSCWRWLAALPWALVAVLFFWPLISGLARHWLF